MPKDCKFEKEQDPLARWAFLIAAISLMLSALIGWKSIQHNELSVMPYIDFGIGFIESEKYNSGISIDNSGLGTAIIESVEIFWKEGDDTVKLESWINLSEKLGVPHTQVIPTSLISGNALKPGRKLFLYAVKWDTDARKILQQKQKNVQVVAHYKSLYENILKGSLHGEEWFTEKD